MSGLVGSKRLFRSMWKVLCIKSDVCQRAIIPPQAVWHTTSTNIGMNLSEVHAKRKNKMRWSRYSFSPSFGKFSVDVRGELREFCVYYRFFYLCIQLCLWAKLNVGLQCYLQDGCNRALQKGFVGTLSDQMSWMNECRSRLPVYLSACFSAKREINFGWSLWSSKSGKRYKSKMVTWSWGSMYICVRVPPWQVPEQINDR